MTDSPHLQHTIRGQTLVGDGDNTEPAVQQDVNQPRRRNSREGQEESSQQSSSGLDAKLLRFGPVYGEDSKANQIAKTLAWEHILQHDSRSEDVYLSCIRQIEANAMRSYDASVMKKVKPGSEFRKMMVRDGCFFLQLTLYILGGREHLKYSYENPYFGEDGKPSQSQWIPAMFFVGNQLPYIVIRALMKQPFFQEVIRKGIESGTWRRPPQELARLVLYQTVVEPELKGSNWPQSLLFWRKTSPPHFRQPPLDILHYLHRLLLGTRKNDQIYSEMKEYPDLEAGRADGITFPSAGELIKRGITLTKAKSGIINIRFINPINYWARLQVPPLMINSDTEHVLRNLISYEKTLKESDREVTSYLRFMRDLAPTYKDFKILERNGIVQVNDSKSKYAVLRALNASHEGNFTLNFRHTRHGIDDYEKPPWGFISLIAAVFTLVQTLFAILPYFVATK